MRVFIDNRTTRNKYQGHGVGVYTKNMISWLPKISPQVTVSTTNWSTCDIYLQPSFYDGFPSCFKGLRAIMVHDVTLLKFNFFSSKGCLINNLRGLEYRYKTRFIKRADLVLTNSENTRQDVLHYFKIPSYKVKVALLGLKDLPFCEVSSEELGIPRDPYLFYVGGVEFNKNIDRLVKAFSQLKSSNLAYDYSNLKLVLAGKGFWQKDRPEAVKIIDLIDSLNLKDSVILPGFIPDNFLRAWYQRSEMFIYPSFYEGFGFPILEAMSCGVPVVASNCSSIPEVGGDAIAYFDPFQVDSIEEKIKEVLLSRKMREILIEKGLVRAKQFSWEKTARRTFQYFQTFLSR